MHQLTRISVSFILGAFAFVAPWTAFAQDDGPEITRADLAVSYLRLETALLDAKLDDAETVRVNRAFDAATLAFFGGKFGEAIEKIDEITASLGGGAAANSLMVLASLRASVNPTVYESGSAENPTLLIEPLYPTAADATTDSILITIEQAVGDAKVLFKFSTGMSQIVDGKGEFALPISDVELPTGRYTIRAGLSEGEALEVGRWSVVSESLDAIAARNSGKLKSIEASTPALEQALASCVGRNALLSDNPSPENTAQLLFDPNQLASEVAAEIAALSKGENPYAGREGDYWRVLKVDSKDSPMRVYLPDSADMSKPLPLVVAFHGAGGDENMFMDAYGAGIIKETADKHGFLLVTPRTYDYGSNAIGDMFDALIEAIGYDYDIDADRIYVLGHSMGGGATNNLINARPTMIAAAAPICGFRELTTSAEETPPTLVIAAEHDPLARPGRVEPGAQKAIDAGLPVEYKLMKNYGHTLVVGDIMHDTIDWLLKHKRD